MSIKINVFYTFQLSKKCSNCHTLILYLSMRCLNKIFCVFCLSIKCLNMFYPSYTHVVSVNDIFKHVPSIICFCFVNQNKCLNMFLLPKKCLNMFYLSYIHVVTIKLMFKHLTKIHVLSVKAVNCNKYMF